MKTVRLKSRVGPTTVTLREQTPEVGYEKRVYEWNIDNSVTVEMPEKDWLVLENERFRKSEGLLYREAFQIL
jgi:hypothetical protein